MLPLHPFAGRIRVALNQRFIRQTTGHSSRLVLAPRPPSGCSGSIAHYYHCLFDLMMPLSFLSVAGVPPNTYQLQHFGPLTGPFREVFGDDIEILTESRPACTSRTVPLLGMNPRCVQWTRRDLERFRRFVFERLCLEHVHDPDTVVLIERMPPDPYYLRSSERTAAGTARRSLLNHSELQDCLVNAVRSSFRFVNLQLETMSLREQVEVFSRTALVVAQHGGGLANLVWMAPGQTAVELDDIVRLHFARLSHACRGHFVRYRLNAPHAMVDVPRFHDWLRRNACLRRFLR